MPPVFLYPKTFRQEAAGFMIEVTRLNDKKFFLNAELIEQVEEVPDTSITLTTGKHFIVKETPLQIKKMIIEYKREIFGQDFLK